MELRPYQRAAADAVEAEWASGRRRTLIVLPTGTGKTVVFAEVIKRVVDTGGRALVLAHRGELLEQAADKIQKTTGLAASVEKADLTSVGTFEAVTVGSVQTLCRPKRLAALGANRFDLIVVDEAHHALTQSYRAVLDYFSHARVLGVTATPDRGDRRDMSEVFDSLAFEYTLPTAIREGYLCPLEAQTLPVKIDMTSVSSRAGDYAAEEVGTALDPYLPEIARMMIEAGCRDRKTVVFLPLIATSKKFQAMLIAAGLDAREVNGQSPDRAEILAAYDAAGKGTVLCNSMLLTEGWDCPSVDCVVVLRPTKVRALYAQMVGRGTRLAPGKESLLILDFIWLTERLDLCRPAHLVAQDAAVATRMTEILEKAGAPEDITEVEVVAQEDVIAQREEALATKLAEQRRKKAKLVDPLQFEMSIAAEDLSGYIPQFAWEMAPASDQQIKALESYGVFGEQECAGKASLLLDRLAKRRAEGLATPKQIRLLERYGFRRVGTWSSTGASSMITRIASNGWRLPHGVSAAEWKPKDMEGGDES
ncbi:DEAD/DEAH box helicase [Collinsella sp. AGMB00827]|uniref:DEAD/DEAH box helicase n=1 Tax=Collinsella ureilytica TaxID=2869515 RepID=A0ABS7MHH3_9ACTN|nr:DEAD/DEAH box helicase [Collinsella urealyticum]MBY4796757.1 DEAD/DEAH box helicase [Collinsella urealyticum]